MFKLANQEEQNIFKILVIIIIFTIIIVATSRYIIRWFVVDTVTENFSSMGQEFKQSYQSMNSEFKEKTETFDQKFRHITRRFAEYPKLERVSPYEQVAIMAAENGDLELVKYLIEEQGMSVNTVNVYRTSLVSKASKGGSLAIVKYLTDKGADLDYPNLSGFAPISFAADSKHPDIVKYLLTYDIGWHGENLQALIFKISRKVGVDSHNIVRINQQINSILRFEPRDEQNVYPEYAKRYPGTIDPEYIEILTALEQYIIDHPGSYILKRPMGHNSNLHLVTTVTKQLERARKIFAETSSIGSSQ